MDGLDAFSNKDTAAGQNRNEPAYLGVQPEKSNADLRRAASDENHGGISLTFFRAGRTQTNTPLNIQPV